MKQFSFYIWDNWLSLFRDPPTSPFNFRIEWTKGCAETASSPLGHRSGFVSFVGAVVSDVVDIHCILHCHALASKTLSEPFKQVPSEAV